jgi:hypothetical protein
MCFFMSICIISALSDFFARWPQGWTALMWAARGERVEAVTTLLDRGAHVNHSDYKVSVLGGRGVLTEKLIITLRLLYLLVKFNVLSCICVALSASR